MTKRSKAGTSKKAAAHRKAVFIEAMVANGGNGKQAAIAAGFSRKTAEQQASRLLRNVKVSAEIDRRRAEALAKARLTTDEVMASLARDLRFDPAKLCREDGTLKPITEMDEHTRRALRGFEYDAKGRSKVRFPEQTAAREQAMKHFGLYEADNTQRPGVTIIASLHDENL